MKNLYERIRALKVLPYMTPYAKMQFKLAESLGYKEYFFVQFDEASIYQASILALEEAYRPKTHIEFVPSYLFQIR